MYAIEFKDVWKQFRRKGITSFRDLALFGKKSERFWALKGISFGIKEGEIFGIIGPNGAGKTTILKLIAKILAPNRGEIKVNGRVATLIELGTGFHPELSGGENIWINGAILRMKRKEIKEKYSSIVKFSGLEKFINTPVKRYSTGMLLRLGFAIVAHVEFDILLVDEVMVVGDVGFRTKCWEKIREFKNQGKTIVIVSHNFGIVSSLCRQTLYLDKGEVQIIGPSDRVIRTYQQKTLEHQKREVKMVADYRVGSGEVELKGVEVLNEKDEKEKLFNTGDIVKIRVYYFAHKVIKKPVFCVYIYNTEGVFCTGITTKNENFEIPEIKGKGRIDFTIPGLEFYQGNYLVTVGITEDIGGEVIENSIFHTKWYDYLPQSCSFMMRPGRQNVGIFRVNTKIEHKREE
jgi:ABC-type polysaccharide/polyol phosphate transport system ATPase subunit